MGARRLTTASSPITSAIFRAVPPVTQPPHVKPMIMVTTMEATQDQKTIVFVGRAALHFSPRLSCRFACSIVVLPVSHTSGSLQTREHDQPLRISRLSPARRRVTSSSRLYIILLLYNL